MTGRAFQRAGTVTPPPGIPVSMPADYAAAEGDAEAPEPTKKASKAPAAAAEPPSQPTDDEMSVLASKHASKNGQNEVTAASPKSRISDEDLDFSMDGAVATPLLHPMHDRRPTGTYLAVALKKALKATAQGSGRSEVDIINDALRHYLPPKVVTKFFEQAANLTGFIGERDWRE